jgi:hypothetical protein
MTSAAAESSDHPAPVPVAEVLAYQAPFLIEKLLKNHIVDSEEEGTAIFGELKKYLIMTKSPPATNWSMYSLRVDEVWHQFILYTEVYREFCNRFFGGYVGHSPSNAPEISNDATADSKLSFADFENRYEQLFGSRVPDLWYDERSVTTSRRVFNDDAGTWTLKDDDDMVNLVHVAGDVIMSINDLARDAVAFIAQTGAFYVRELPGDLTGEEKVTLIATLVEHKLLRVAA